MARVTRIGFPAESRLQARFAQATFHDAFEARLHDPGLAAADIAARAFAATPAWMEGLLRLRDNIVRPLGLKTVGPTGGETGRGPPVIGGRMSIFQVESIDDRELVLGIDDSHLDVRISFLKRAQGPASSYVVASLVQTHNLLGRAYMIPVGLAHPVLVRLMMAGTVI